MSHELGQEMAKARRGCKAAKAIWITLLVLIALGCIAIVKFFRSMGVEFHTIAGYWRWGLIALAPVLVGVAVVITKMSEKEFLVKIAFSGTDAPKEDMEIALKAGSAEDARTRAAKHAEAFLERQGLFSFVSFNVISCEERPAE